MLEVLSAFTAAYTCTLVSTVDIGRWEVAQKPAFPSARNLLREVSCPDLHETVLRERHVCWDRLRGGEFVFLVRKMP